MPRSLAERTRDAARDRPFLLSALAAGVVNYAAAARYLDVDGDPEAVATALSRFAGELDLASDRRTAPVTMKSGVGVADPDAADPILVVGDVAVTEDGDGHTALLATGEVDAAALGAALTRLAQSRIDPVAAGVGGETMVVVVPDGDGPDALRIVEGTLGSVPVVQE